MARIVNKQTEIPQVVAVNVATLSQGMKMMFEGCAMIFDSIGVDGSMISAAVPGTPVTEDTKPEKQETEKPAETQVKAEPVKEEVSAAQNADDQSADTHVELEQEAVPQKASADPVSTVTVNDIIRIASAKITANRKNSEKIGALVRSYGVSKMSELPEDKFEAFLTDISQL